MPGPRCIWPVSAGSASMAANNVCPDDRYVRIRDPASTTATPAPVSGLVHGAARETLTVGLTVEQTQSQSQQGQEQSQSQA